MPAFPTFLLLLALLTTAATTLLAAPAGIPAQAQPNQMREQPSPSSALKTYEGTLKTGMMAIGGETTGTLLTTAEGTYELAIQSPALKETAEKLNGKKVIVEGLYKPRKGVEVKERRIIEVHALSPAK